MIFLSYTWRNQKIAHELDTQLRLAGFEVWIDHRNLQPDSDILGQLDRAIKGCEIFVTANPDRNVGSSWMRTELSIARAYGKAVVPFLSDPKAFATRIGIIARAIAGVGAQYLGDYGGMTMRKERIVEGVGNVCADLRLENANELLVSAELTHLIHAELRDRHMTQAEAARLLGIEEAEAAQLIAGRFVRFPTERLLHLLTALDRDVEIVVRPRPSGESRARLRVVSAAA